MADINYMLKTVYDSEGVKHLENKATTTWKKIATSSRKPGGLGFEFSANLEGNQKNLGAISFDQALPNGGTQSGVRGLIVPTETVQVVRLTGYNIAQGQTDDMAYAETLVEQLDQGIMDHAKECNQQLFRAGNGVIAQVNGAVSASATVPVDNGVITHFRLGMKVAFYTGAGALEANEEVVDVNIGAGTITLANAVTLTDNDNIYRIVGSIDTRSTGVQKELAGLKLLTDDGTISATYENINRTTNPGFQGISIDMNGANLSDDTLQRLRARIKVESGADVTSASHMIVVNPAGQTRKYMQILTPAREYTVVGDKQPKMDSSGDVAMTWYGLEWVEDTDCGFDEVYILSKQDVKKYILKDVQYNSEFSGGILKWDAGRDAAIAYSYSYLNVGTERPNRSARLFDLAVPSY